MSDDLTGFIGGIVVIVGIHSFIRYGSYKRTQVDRNGELLYETPSLLRLPLLVFYGFTVAMLFSLLGVSQMPNKEILDSIGFLLTLLLILLEPRAGARGYIQRKRITFIISLVLGFTLALIVIS